MDLNSVGRAAWRHKFVLLPMIVLTLAAAGYVGFFIPSTYEATSSYAVVNPPSPPTEAEVARDPSLAEINSDNPFLRFSDSSVIINIVARRVSTDERREDLTARGADDRYEVTPSARFGFASPIIDIRAVADAPDDAVRTAEVVGDEVIAELRDLQEAEDVEEPYFITTLQVEAPTEAEEIVSDRLRPLLAVLGAGAVLVFLVTSVLNAVDRARAARRAAGGAARDSAPASEPLVGSDEEPAAPTDLSTGWVVTTPRSKQSPPAPADPSLEPPDDVVDGQDGVEDGEPPDVVPGDAPADAPAGVRATNGRPDPGEARRPPAARENDDATDIIPVIRDVPAPSRPEAASPRGAS